MRARSRRTFLLPDTMVHTVFIEVASGCATTGLGTSNSHRARQTGARRDRNSSGVRRTGRLNDANA